MNTQITALAHSQDILIKRSFAAAADLVFKLFVEKDLQIRWQSAFLQDFAFEAFEPTNGGSFHSTHTGADGQKYGFKGVYHELIPNEKIIKTSEFLGLPFKVTPTLEILTFVPNEDGTTSLNIQIICDSTTTRDAMVQHGMQAHFDAIFGFMDTLLNT